VNLFERIAEPIRVSQTKTEYRVIPDQHRQSATEIYSIDRVTSTATYLEEPQDYHPFYALRHGSDEAQKHFWYAQRRQTFRKNDKGTETYISLVNLAFNPSYPPDETLTLHVTCTNRDQASALDLSGQFGELEAEDVSLVRGRCIRKPTATVRPTHRRGLQWRLISHLSLNHLSIVGHEALQEILRLYDFSSDPDIRRQIAGIVDVQSRSSVGRVNSDVGVTFCRGTDVVIEFDEGQYVGTGVFLLSSVLQRFLALYSAVNSFTRVTAKTQKGVVKQWAPMAGEQILL
jgi:type VI secretion system protein ImpG